jgi:hypothetical protein
LQGIFRSESGEQLVDIRIIALLMYLDQLKLLTRKPKYQTGKMQQITYWSSDLVQVFRESVWRRPQLAFQNALAYRPARDLG